MRGISPVLVSIYSIPGRHEPPFAIAEEHRRQNRRRYYMTAYLSLGSNVGDRGGNLREAIARLAPAVRVLRVSPVYETAPVDYTDQDWFLNLVVEAETDLPAAGLLAHTAGIER